MSTSTPERLESQTDKSKTPVNNQLSNEAQSLFHSLEPAAKNAHTGVLDFGNIADLYGTHAATLARSGETGMPVLPSPSPEASPPPPPMGNPNATHPFSPSEITSGGMNYDPMAHGYETIPGSMGVEQTTNGTCWFEASVAALASTTKGRQDISNAITSNRDGSYTVTFPGDKTHPVNVTQADLDKMGINDSAQWAKVLQAAIVKYDPSEAKNGGYSSKAFKLLTGHDVQTEEAVHSDGSWWNPFDSGHDSLGDINNGLAKGDAITVSSNSGTHMPVEGDHQFQVVSTDPSKQTITLRNPWGGNADESPDNHDLPAVGQTKDGVTDLGGGEITMSYATFRKYYSTVDISQG